MKNVLWIVVAVCAALLLQNTVLTAKTAPVAKAETAYDRVIRTGTLRCAYAIYEPWLGKDPNTGKVNGVAADVMAAFEQASGLKIEWGPEIDWGSIAATLQNGKADAFCATVMATPQRGRVLGFSTPLLFSTIEAFVRADDKRFDNNPDRLNQPDVRIAVNMGDLSEEVARRLFPKAQLVYKSPMSGESELFLNVVSNKADVTLSGPSNLTSFNAANPHTVLRKVVFDRSLVSYAVSFAVEIHEDALLKLIDTTLHHLNDIGVTDRILRARTGKDYGVSYFPPTPRFK